MCDPELRIRRIAMAAASIAGVVIATVVLVLLWLRTQALPSGGARLERPDLQVVPGPVLQSAPQLDRKAYLVGKVQRLHGLGWVDASRGLAHIPIEEAMALMASSAPLRTSAASHQDASPRPTEPGLHPRPPEPGLHPRPPEPGLHPRPGAQLPMDLPLIDSSSRPTSLRAALGKGPAVLVLGYYRCPQLCGLLMHGLLEALHEAQLPLEHYRVLRVSIDAREGPADSQARQAADLAYARFLEGAQSPAQSLALQALTGPPATLQALTRAVGYQFRSDQVRHVATGQGAVSGRTAKPLTDATVESSSTFAHPAVAIVITSEGRVWRYLGGLRFDPQTLRKALTEAGVSARQGQVQSGPGTDPAKDAAHSADAGEGLALLCTLLDPRLGRHSATVLQGLQASGLLLVLCLVVLFRRLQAGGRR